MHHLRFAFAAERAHARRRFVENDPEREDIAPPIDRRAIDLLRRHVRDLAFELSRARRFMKLAERLRDAEVADLRNAVRRAEDVVGAEIAMDDVEEATLFVRELVRRVESGTAVGDD